MVGYHVQKFFRILAGQAVHVCICQSDSVHRIYLLGNCNICGGPGVGVLYRKVIDSIKSGGEGTGDAPTSRSPVSESQVNFLTYRSVMVHLGISRRTLQRWMDDMVITPLNFDGTKLMFLTRVHIASLEDYKRIMHSGDSVLIQRYRAAVQSDDPNETARLLAQLD